MSGITTPRGTQLCCIQYFRSLLARQGHLDYFGSALACLEILALREALSEVLLDHKQHSDHWPPTLKVSTVAAMMNYQDDVCLRGTHI